MINWIYWWSNCNFLNKCKTFFNHILALQSQFFMHMLITTTTKLLFFFIFPKAFLLYHLLFSYSLMYLPTLGLLTLPMVSPMIIHLHVLSKESCHCSYITRAQTTISLISPVILVVFSTFRFCILSCFHFLMLHSNIFYITINVHLYLYVSVHVYAVYFTK